MANLIREAMPDLHAAFLESLSDEIVYQPQVGETFTLTACQGSTILEEGLDPRVFRSYWAVDSSFPFPPAKRDTVLVGSTLYTVFAIHRDDYGKVTLTLQIKGNLP